MASNDNHSLRNLASQSSNSRWRFTRSTANLREVASQAIPGPTAGQSSGPPKVVRAPSKMSLFNLFSRPKVERARGHTEVGLAVPMGPQTPPKVAIPPESTLRQHPPPAAQQSIRSRSSMMFRPMSMRPPHPDVDAGSWEPPPLFQAFPQSVKHATVQACVFPPEMLMRTQSQRRQAELIREKIGSALDLSVIEENSTGTKKLEKSHRRLTSKSVLNPPTPELVNKIYILVTAGYVLQYAGDGPYDRLPEKVLKLGKESAAFACDLIPGKHWVLQISSHAHDDGTIEMEPRTSLLSRLRTQTANGRKAPPSFLLVLDSAGEMDAWMTAVRKEIENNGGPRMKDDPVRSSASIDGSSGKQSTETSHRYLVQRDPNVITKIAPIDSPRQSFHALPLKIVTSDRDHDRTERTPSVASSTDKHSSRQSVKRQSADMSSASSTPVSQVQMQLDSLRGRSRYSYMSTATTASGSGTRNTSRDSSPAPQSPLKEGFTPVEAEPFRHLRSFHSNPNNDTGSRRRSVQPLPVTTEDSSLSVEVPAMRQRHSFYGFKTPTIQEPPKVEVTTPPASATKATPAPPPPFVAAKGLTAHIAEQARSASSDRSNATAASTSLKDREDSPVRFNATSYGTMSRERTISPPPQGPPPAPPRSAQRQSFSHPSSYVVQAPSGLVPFRADPSRQRRISATPKPFLRPFPVRPQAQHASSNEAVQRRVSSVVPPSSHPSLSSLATRSVTAPPPAPSAARVLSPATHASTLHSAASSQSLRRPTSVQIRSDPAPFLSSMRPALVISSTPSFIPGTGRRGSITPPPTTTASAVLQPSPGHSDLRNWGQNLAPSKNLMARKSMPVISLPPPAPPPDMPLPAPPPNMPLPAPPPNMPLPAPPNQYGVTV